MLNNFQYSTYRHPRDFPADVSDLFFEAENSNFEYGTTWYGNFIDTVGYRLGETRFYVLRKCERVVIVLPLLFCFKNSFNRRVQSLSNYYTSLYCPVCTNSVTPEDFAALFRHINVDNPGIHAIQLYPLAAESRITDMLLPALRYAGFFGYSYFCFQNWILKVDQSWEEYLASREHRVRNTLKRKGKKFVQRGGCMEVVSGKECIESALDDFQRVYRSSWKTPEPFEGFIPGLISIFGDRGWLRIGIARIEDKPVAAQIWITKGKRASIFKLAYDNSYRDYSPGTLLTEKLMEHAFNVDKVLEIDYMQGDDLYKREWMNSHRERIGVIAYNSRSIFGLSFLVENWLKNVIRGSRRTTESFKPAK